MRDLTITVGSSVLGPLPGTKVTFKWVLIHCRVDAHCFLMFFSFTQVAQCLGLINIANIMLHALLDSVLKKKQSLIQAIFVLIPFRLPDILLHYELR